MIKIFIEYDIKSKEDLEKLKVFNESNNIDKPTFSELGRKLGIDRRTVKNHYEGISKNIRKRKKSVLDEYYSLIESLLSDNNTQRFYYKAHLYRYLSREHNLSCKENTFNYFINNHQEFSKYFNHRQNSNSVKTETPFGKQAQFDWKEKINFQFSNGDKIIINVASIVFAASRMKFWMIYTSVVLDNIIDFMVNVFEKINGVPIEIIIDNATTMMLSPRTGRQSGIINKKFEQFSKDMGFIIKPALAGRPQTKAKVESPMKLIDEIRAYSGTLNNLDELIDKLIQMNDEANSRISKATGLPPIFLFKKEKEHLLSLPHKRVCSQYKIITKKARVNQNSLFLHRNNFYSVSNKLINKTVDIQIIDNQLYVYYNKELEVIHSISDNKINYNINHHTQIYSDTFKNKENIKDYSNFHLKELEVFNEQISSAKREFIKAQTYSNEHST
jgi:transposase